MFKIGDRVRCIDATFSYDCLKSGDIYTIGEINGNVIELTIGSNLGHNEWWDAKRFELVEPQFKRGDKVLLWNIKEDAAIEGIFLAYIKGSGYPYVCVSIYI